MIPSLVDIARARPLIEAALEYTHGATDFYDVRRAIIEGKMQMWLGVKSVAITEITGPVLHIFLVAGDINEIEAQYPIVEAWAKQHGCTSAVCTGRPGWERSFLTKRAGWTPELRVYHKAL